MSHRIEASVEIAAPIDTDVAWLVDRERMSAWQGSEAQWLPVDRRELAVGYRGVQEVTLPLASGVTVNNRLEQAENAIEVTATTRPGASPRSRATAPRKRRSSSRSSASPRGRG